MSDMRKVPWSYREQRACANCAHLFRFMDYEGEGLYCAFCAPTRPKCGSLAMKGERFVESWPDKDAEWRAEFDAWTEWARPREVEPHGICTSWCAMPESADESRRDA